MAQTSRSADLTSGPMLQKIILFSLPLAASSILQLLFNAADVVVVGRFAGSTALAAVGSNGSLINLLVNLFVGLSLGANVVAARCFGAAGCKLAVVELPDAGLASALPNMPVCAVTAIGPDGVSRSVERLAALAAGVMRKDAVCVTAPEQPKAVLSELVVAAAKAECELVVPDAEDITFLEAEKFTSKVDYGGYTAPLAFLGRHAAGNAAVAVELALALWRKGFEIPDEAILAGLAAVENRSSIRVLSQKPLIILDACRTPQQAAALLRVLNMAKVRHMSAVIGLTEEEGAESFLAALETGLTSEEQKKDKSTMPGMGENPFDKVFLVAPAGTEAALAERLTEKARYHFDAVFCPTLAEAVEQAKANSRRGLLVCGSEAIALEALKLFS